MDLLYEQKNKELGINGVFGRFLLLYSNASSLNETEFNEMVRLEKRNKIFERMSDVLTSNYLHIQRQWLKQKQGGSYFVITANKKQSEIASYPTFEKAEAAYLEKYYGKSDSNIVLTHLKNPDFYQISMAYSNYVLALHAFFDDYRAILAKRIVNCVLTGSYVQFFRFFKVYNRDVRCHFNNMIQEINSIETCVNDDSISRNQINKCIKELRRRMFLWRDESKRFLYEMIAVSNGSHFRKCLIKNRTKRLSKVISREIESVK